MKPFLGEWGGGGRACPLDAAVLGSPRSGLGAILFRFRRSWQCEVWPGDWLLRAIGPARSKNPRCAGLRMQPLQGHRGTVAADPFGHIQRRRVRWFASRRRITLHWFKRFRKMALARALIQLLEPGHLLLDTSTHSSILPSQPDIPRRDISSTPPSATPTVRIEISSALMICRIAAPEGEDLETHSSLCQTVRFDNALRVPVFGVRILSGGGGAAPWLGWILSAWRSSQRPAWEFHKDSTHNASSGGSVL